MDRRTLLVAALAAPAIVARAAAQTSDRAARLVVPYAPGGVLDTLARLYATRLGPALGETWIVENRSGGNGTVGSMEVMRAAPNGRTLVFSSDIHLVARQVLRAVPYDPLTDFTPVARVASGTFVLVGHPSLGAANLRDLVAAARARPAGYAFANTSLGAMNHLATETFRRVSGADLLVVSYRGTGPAMNDLVGGQVALMMAPILTAAPMIAAGRLRAYGVTAAARHPLLPDVPTMAEAGMPGMEFTAWYAIWGPKDLPAAVTGRLNAAARAVTREPETAARLRDLGCDPLDEDAATFARVAVAEHERNSRILQDARFEPE